MNTKNLASENLGKESWSIEEILLNHLGYDGVSLSDNAKASFITRLGIAKGDWSIESILDHVLWEDMEREVQKLSLSDDVKALLLSIFHREKQILLNILSGIATSYLMKYSVDRFELQISAIQNAFSKARETLFSSQGELSPYLREPNDILYIMVREAFQMSQ